MVLRGNRWVLSGCVYLVALMGADSPAAAHPGIDTQIADLDARLAENADDVDLLLRRADLQRFHMNFSAARRDLDRVRHLDRSNRTVFLLLGKVEIDDGRPKRAVKALDRFLAAEPRHAGGRVARAEAWVALGRHLRAARDYSVAIEASPRPTPADYLGRARALTAAGPARRAEALRGLEEGLERLGRPISLELEALALEQAWGMHDDALARLDRLLAAANRKEPWLIRRGALLEAVGRNDEASSAYAKALAAIEDLPPARRQTRGADRLRAEADEALARLQSKE